MRGDRLGASASDQTENSSMHSQMTPCRLLSLPAPWSSSIRQTRRGQSSSTLLATLRSYRENILHPESTVRSVCAPRPTACSPALPGQPERRRLQDSLSMLHTREHTNLQRRRNRWTL